REKVAYYNLYAEKQQADILEQAPKVKYKANQSLSDFVSDLIPQIDELQKMSRFPQNQLVVSAGLTKIGLSLRRALQTTKVKKS
ncbi:hypothetical protein IJJ27_03755, partial [bacterium]|nr:hypothetical protein [bacterium]